MIIIASILSVVVFWVAFKVTGIYTITLNTMTSIRKATDVIRDRSLDDEQKEFLIKQSSIHLLKRFVQITVIGTFLCGLPILVLLVFDLLNMASFQETTNFFLRWEGLLTTTVGAVIVNIVWR